MALQDDGYGAPSGRIDTVPAGYLYFMDHRISDEIQESFPLWDRDIFRIGRDPRHNTLGIQGDSDHLISRNHCEIYVVVYEPSVNHVYVRDRKSFNGTYVNGDLIGIGPGICSGHLLQDGDIIEIQPHWRFLFRQYNSPPPKELTETQKEECKMFSERYVLSRRCLGQGSEAAVFLAIEKATKKQVVCKLVNFDKISSKTCREESRRKLQEADILRQLQHPNILPYVDAISSPHSLYTFTELAAGGDLMSFLYRHETVAEFDARIILRQVARGLSYLHSKGIVHRDLKPENILLAYSPKIAYHRVMLADFGTCAVPRRSRMLTNVGTANYQAPEFRYSDMTQTEAVDIWSLGVITLLLLTNNLQIDGGRLNMLEEDALQKTLDMFFDSAGVKVPSSNGQAFVFACLRVNPSRRINAIEAECHDWLCTPEKHLDFFKHLDKRMIGDWKVQLQVRPIPMTLPDVAVPRSMPVISVYFEADQMDLMKIPSLREEISEAQITERSAAPTSKQPLAQIDPNIQRAPPPDSFVKPMSPQRYRAARAESLKTAMSKKTNMPWAGFDHPKKLITYSKRQAKRTPKIRIRDTAFLPLPGLDRHLRRPASGDHREKVLQELQRTNSTFLSSCSLQSPTISAARARMES